MSYYQTVIYIYYIQYLYLWGIFQEYSEPNVAAIFLSFK